MNTAMGFDTLQRAKNDLKQGWETPNGATCACCGRKVKRYHRKLTSSMAIGLIKLVRLNHSGNGDFQHVSELGISGTGGEFAQLKRWGLIEELVNEDSKKRTSGYWTATDKGDSFVFNRVKVPAYCDTYNMKTLGFSDEQTTIIQALGKKFDYRELMGYLI